MATKNKPSNTMPLNTIPPTVSLNGNPLNDESRALVLPDLRDPPISGLDNSRVARLEAGSRFDGGHVLHGSWLAGQDLQGMKTKGILFKGSMVRAILAGTKTQTRRLVKDPAMFGCLTGDCPHDTQRKCDLAIKEWAKSDSPYAKGYLLYVKETHWLFGKWIKDGLTKRGRVRWRFKIDPLIHEACFEPPHVTPKRTGNGWHKRPSIFMRRKHSRITLEVAGVRVQRLNEISEEDCRAEGIEEVKSAGGCRAWKDYQCDAGCCEDARNSYRSLWNSINGLESWALNPFVFAYTFRRITPQVREQI